LDEIVNSGYSCWQHDVVAGVSDVGKSVMALQYIAKRRGERSLMLGLDEQIMSVLPPSALILRSR